jgi:hypothetical protein
MGSERAVTRWCLRQQTILKEIATLEAALETAIAQSQAPASGTGSALSELRPGEMRTGHAIKIEQQLHAAQEKLNQLGPCPKPMMG